MSELTTTTLHDAPTMTGIVDRLEKADLVERVHSDTDRRVVLVRATPSGLNLVCRVQERWLTDDVAGCASLSDDDLAETEQMIRDIFRIHLRRTGAVDDSNLEEAMRKLDRFLSDPTGFVSEQDKLEPWCVSDSRSVETAG